MHHAHETRSGSDHSLCRGRTRLRHRGLEGYPGYVPARTLLDLAGVVDEEALEVALDDALCTHKVRLARPKWRLEQLGTKGKHGPALLARLLKVRGEGAVVPTTILETKLVRLLRTAKLPIGKAQHVFPEKGRPIARVDFVYPEQRVVIEVDGTRWHAGRRARVRDAERDNYLNIRGWIVLRFTWFDLVERPTYVVGQIRDALASTHYSCRNETGSFSPPAKARLHNVSGRALG